jgi:hypothetical protein
MVIVLNKYVHEVGNKIECNNVHGESIKYQGYFLGLNAAGA